MADEVVYPVDYTGEAVTNLIVREPHVLTEVNTATRRILVPYTGPFYRHNFKFEHRDNNGNYTKLVEAGEDGTGGDYYFCLRYLAGELATSKEVYGGICVTNDFQDGMLFLTYQTLGTGWWNGLRQEVLERIASSVYNPRAGVWDMIANLPEVFPPQGHQQNLEDFRKLEDLIAAINQIGDKLEVPVPPGLFYPQMVVECLAAYEGVLQQVQNLQNDVAMIKQHLGLN